jgi:hypothetical protein
MGPTGVVVKVHDIFDAILDELNGVPLGMMTLKLLIEVALPLAATGPKVKVFALGTIRRLKGFVLVAVAVTLPTATPVLFTCAVIA